MTATKIRPVQATAPERIYLQGGPQLPPETEFGALSEVTWCRDDVDGTGIPYVRADLAGAAPAAGAGPADELAELALLNKLIELGGKASYAHAKSNSDDGHAGTAAYVQWQELRAEMGELIRAHAAPALEAPAAPESAPWCPDVCPITGRPFFMWIDHWQTGKPVPTYGGPYDSYTIPVKDSDGSFECERYDHDEGGWLTEGAGWHCLGVKLANDQSFVVDPSNPRYNEIEAFAAAAPQASAAPTDPLCWVSEDELPDSMTTGAYNALYPHSRVDMVRMFPIFGPAAPAAPAVDAMSQAARDVLAERRRQVNAEGFSPERDDQYVGGQLAGAAISYLILAAGGREDEARAFWPWRQEWLKPGSQRRYLEKTGALVLAEMERLDRAATQGSERP